MSHLFNTEARRDDPVEAALGFNVWLVCQDRSREQRSGKYKEGLYHTQKMVPELARRMIEHAGLPAGSLIGDCFAGSCTTGVEAIGMGHFFLGIEIEGEHWERSGVPNLVRAEERCPRSDGVFNRYNFYRGDARRMDNVQDQTVDLWVTSPPYGDSDPARDSSGDSLEARVARGEDYAVNVARTSALARGTLKPSTGALGSMGLLQWKDAMLQALREMRRTVKPGGFVMLALREYWTDAGMVDLPGIVLAMAPEAGLIPHDQVYAIEAAIDKFGILLSRASLHQNRLARQQRARGHPCPRGVPAVTRVVILRRRERKS